MTLLALQGDEFLGNLEREARDAAEPHWVLDAVSGACLCVNRAATELLGMAPQSPIDRSTMADRLAVLLVAPGTVNLNALLGVTRLRPLMRETLKLQLQPGSSTWVEWTSVWVETPRGLQVHARARQLSAREIAIAATLTPQARLHGAAADGATRDAVALLAVDTSNGQSRLQFADEGFLGAFQLEADAVLAPHDWLATGLTPFDAICLLSAALNREVLTMRVDLPSTEGHSSWQIEMVPKGQAGGSSTVHSLLTARELSPDPVHRRRFERAPAADHEVRFACHADGTIDRLDPGWLGLTGVPPADAIGHPFTSYFHPAAQASCDAAWAPLLSGVQMAKRQEWPLLHPTTGVRWIEVRVWRSTEGAAALSGTLVDITARVDEQRIDNVKKSALESSVNGVLIADYSQRGIPTVYVSEGFVRMTGYRPGEVIGRACSFLQAGLPPQPEVDVMRQALSKAEPATVVLKNTRKDGSHFWNRVQLSPVREPLTGSVTHYVAVLTDVTGEKRAEQIERDRAAEFERLIEHVPLGMLSFDAGDRLRFVNPALRRLTGLSTDELLGADSAQVLALLQQACGEVGAILSWPPSGSIVQWQLTTPARRQLEVSTVDLDGQGTQHVYFLRDVTAEMEQVQARLQFLASVAHELRAPMASIRGFTELMLMRDYPRDQSVEMLDTVSRQSVRLNSLLTDLTDLSKLEAQGSALLPCVRVDLAKAINQAVRLVRTPQELRAVRCVWPHGQHAVMSNEPKLEQVLVNLLSNALKYSPQGGEVSITAGDRCTERPGWVDIAVTDHGLGISATDQLKLFTRFFRADPNGPISGTGLGLTIVKEIIERMQGAIEVKSVLGQGSTFTVWLPAAA